MEKREIHYLYAISYLISLIILIISLAYYDVPELVDKFSFALTLSSLLLAVLAIFYTIISANKQDSQFFKIIEATSQLSGVVKNIDSAANSMILLTKEIPVQFQSISTKIDGIQSLYKSPTEMEINRELEVDESELSNEELVHLKSIIGEMQFAGMAVLYMFVKAFRKGKSIEYADFEDFNIATLDYAVGMLSGFEATKLIDFKLHKNSIIPIHCDKFLAENLRKELDLVVSIVEEKSATKLSTSMEWVDNKYC
ncbi:hypothetical protein ACSZOI_12365 [Aeromonas caviae]